MPFKPGQEKTAGRKAGSLNKATSQFKEALNHLLEEASPKMIEWLDRIAVNDPGKALDMISRLAEYIHPKLARSEGHTTSDNKHTISWEK